MDKMDEIRQFLLEFYSMSFKRKEPIASLFHDIEILILMIEEDPDMFLSQLHAEEIQMYNYLQNEMVAEIPQRKTNRHINDGIPRVVHNPRPISGHTNRDIFKPKPKVPDFSMIEDFILNMASPPGNAVVGEQINLNRPLPETTAETLREPNFELPGDSHIQPQPGIIIHEQDGTLPEEQISALPIAQIADVESIEEQISAFPMAQVPDVENTEQQISALPKAQLADVAEMQQFPVGESSIIPPAPIISGSLYLSCLEELPNRQQGQSVELDEYVTELPVDEDFIREFEELFDRRRREKAAVDYAARATRRSTRSRVNFMKYRNLERSIANLRPVPKYTLRVIPKCPQISFTDISSIARQLMIRPSQKEFTNQIANKPQSTPELSFSGKKKTKKWTSALPILEEDQTDVQKATDALDITTKSKSTEFQKTPLTANEKSKKPQQILNRLPVLSDEIEMPPAAEVSNQDVAAECPGLFVQEEIPPALDRLATDTHYSISAQQLQSAKRPKLDTEEANPATKKREDANAKNAAFKQHLKTWANSSLVHGTSSNSQDVHLPIDPLNILELGKPVHDVLKDVIGNSDRSQLLPSTYTRREAAQAIRILLELRAQYVIEFESTDGVVTGVRIADN